MKKVLLTLAALATCAATIKAQQRMILYEEFTGENCPPCAAYNPGLWTLVTGGTNPSKIEVIKYMSPIPSPGQFYYQNQTQTDAVINYYNVPFAPYGLMDGAVPNPSAGSNAGNIADFNQAEIDAESAIAAPFNITVTSVYNSTYDSVTATINITCVAPYTGTNVHLRTALVETVNWPAPPGTNGETNFENVVRTMYPNNTGTSLAASWTAGQTQTITIKGAVPAYVDRQGSPYIVTWIQNDGDKKVAQAAKSAALPVVPVDIASQSVTSNITSTCTGGTSTNFTPSVTIKNTGTVTLTTATIYYKVDNDAGWASAPWTGSLNPGATAQFSLPTIAVTGGNRTIKDSVGMPNGVADANPGNNNSSVNVTVMVTAQQNLPISCTFEPDALPNGWLILGNANTAGYWGVYYSGATGVDLGHNSTWAAAFITINASAGDKTYLVMPTPVVTNPTTLDFWVAAAEQSSSSTDALDIVYSTDCASTWTSVWNKSGADLATTTSYHTNDVYLPAATDWKHYSASLNSLPANCVLAFRGTAGNGNVMILDDINVTNFPVGVNNVVADNGISIYPNPAKDNAVLSMTLTAAAKIQIAVIDAVGRTAINMNDMQLTAGTQHIDISTATLASGLYTVKIMSDNGVISTQRLSVVK